MKGRQPGDLVEAGPGRQSSQLAQSFIGESSEERDWSAEFSDFLVHCEAALVSYTNLVSLFAPPPQEMSAEPSNLKDLSVVPSLLPANNLCLIWKCIQSSRINQC